MYPYQTQLDQIQNVLGRQPQSIPQVEGLAGAGEYLKRLPPNSTAAVFDKNEAVFYGLAVDANGTPAPIKIGRFTLEDAPEPGSNNITRQDFDAFRKEIREALESLRRTEE